MAVCLKEREGNKTRALIESRVASRGAPPLLSLVLLNGSHLTYIEI